MERQFLPIKRKYLEQMLNIVNIAKEKSLYYRKSYIKFQKIKSLYDFEKLPILTSEIFKEVGLELLTIPLRDAYRIFSTGGTTGIPKIVIHDQNFFENGLKLIGKKVFTKMGVSKNHIVFNLLPFTGLTIGGPGVMKLAEGFGIPSINIGMNVKSEIAISLFRKFEYPKILFVFPSHFSVFTKKLEQLSNIQKFNVTHIVTGGEPLGESNRILFHKKWKAEVFNQYASTEVGPIGWECREHNGLHLIEESVYPEVIRVSANEKISSGEGQLIVTSLWEKSMPFIRYQIGEIVELFNEKCKCGWNTPRIKIKGRVDELIFLAGAVKIYPSYFETIIKSFKGLTDTYQIIIDKAGDKEQLFFRIEAEDWIINNFHKIKGKLVRVLSRATPDLSEAIYEDRLIDFPKIELLPIGTLSRTKLGKLKKRIIDKRIIDK